MKQNGKKRSKIFIENAESTEKISVDRLCPFGMYYHISGACASLIFEKRLYLFIISVLIIFSSIEVLILYVQCFFATQAASQPRSYDKGLGILRPGFDAQCGSDNFLFQNKICTHFRSSRKIIAYFIVFNDSLCLPESTTPRKKFESYLVPKNSKK